MKTTLISTGEELVSGRTVDTNASFLAEHLNRHGFNVRRFVVLGDDPEELTRELERCARDSGLIVMTGGLGPTADDRTRGAVARAVGAELVEDEASRRHVEERLRGFGVTPHAGHLTQALFPAGATVFPNPVGTARGFACRLGESWIVAMPGVPGEMRPMFLEIVLPFLLERIGPPGCVRSEVVNLFPASESAVDERIADMMAPGRNPTVGITAHGGVICVSLRATGPDAGTVDALIEADLEILRERFGELVFGYGQATLAEALSEQLESSGLSIAVAESVTGGRVCDMLVSVPGISRFFLAGVVAYSNDAKERLLGVPAGLIEAHGAVSAQAAEAMARGVAGAAGADIGVSTTGIAGPAGATERKPVGLVFVGLFLGGRSAVARFELGAERERVRDRAAKHALNMARLAAGKGLDSLACLPYNAHVLR